MYLGEAALSDCFDVDKAGGVIGENAELGEFLDPFLLDVFGSGEKFAEAPVVHQLYAIFIVFVVQLGNLVYSHVLY
jgi:hypothetical protein